MSSGARSGFPGAPLALAALLLLAAPAASLAQGTGAGDGWRIGVTFGGISTAGLVIERFRDANSLELTLGTFAFRDLGVSPVVKHYFGGRAARPYVGGGLWMVLGSGSDARRTGVALVARIPVGVDWNVSGRHAVGADITLNRALAIRRPDPDDDRPLNRRIVPLPGLYYRHAP